MGEDELELLRKFKDIIEVSREVKKTEIAKYLGMSEELLFEKLIRWGKDMPFKIKGDLIEIDDMNEFVDALDRQFVAWESKENSKIGKIVFNKKLIQESEELIKIENTYLDHSYRGILLVEPEYFFMTELENLIGEEVPVVSELENNIFGFISQNNHVTQLGVYNKQLSSLPESLGSLTSLTHLYLYYNKLPSLPKSIGNLISLKELELKSNQLSSLPESIGNLKSLQHLNIGYNKLTSLPEGIGNLKSLERLNLYVNQLTSLPESIGNLRSLQHLNIANNKLTSLSESLRSLKSLQYLNTRYNKITSLSETIKKWLKTLEKKGCKIEK